MIISLCVDDRGGMLFNARRQSRDAALVKNLMELAGKRRVLISPFSKILFSGYSVIAGEDFLSQAGENDICFVENSDISPYIKKANEFVIYKWNRKYPYDVKFDFSFLNEFKMRESVDFTGKSHDKITREHYFRVKK